MDSQGWKVQRLPSLDILIYTMLPWHILKRNITRASNTVMEVFWCDRAFSLMSSYLSPFVTHIKRCARLRWLTECYSADCRALTKAVLLPEGAKQRLEDTKFNRRIFQRRAVMFPRSLAALTPSPQQMCLSLAPAWEGQGVEVCTRRPASIISPNPCHLSCLANLHPMLGLPAATQS